MGPGAERQAAREAAKSEALSVVYAGVPTPYIEPRQFLRRAERKNAKAKAAAERFAVIRTRRAHRANRNRGA